MKAIKLPTIFQIPAPASTSSGFNLNKALGIGALGIAGFFLGRKVYRDWKSDKADGKIATSVPMQQAIDLHVATSGAGTNEKVIFDIANQIKDWDAVKTAYFDLYSVSVRKDLEEDLNPEEMKKFLDIIRLNEQKRNPKTYPQSSASVKRGSWAIAKADVNIRKTPLRSGSSKMDMAVSITPLLNLLNVHSNIITTVPKGSLIGLLTGKTEIDSKADEAVLFYEVMTYATDTKKELTMWVAASQVETMSNEERNKRKLKPVLISQVMYNKAGSGK